MRAGLCLWIALLTLAVVAALPAHAGTYDEYRRLSEEGVAAYQAGDKAGALERFEAVLALRPYQPRILLNAAVIAAELDRKDPALGYLARYAALGLTVRGPLEVFDPYAEDPGLQETLARLRRNERPLTVSAPAFEVPSEHVLIEGLAYDPVDQTTYLSSVVSRRIIRTQTGAAPEIYLGTERLQGFSVFGMAVDPARRLLWATLAAVPQTPVPERYKAIKDRTALARIDLRSREVTMLPAPQVVGAALQSMGDVAVGPDGSVYVSDARAGALYGKPADARFLRLIARHEDWSSLQGLAVHPESALVLVADYAMGLYRVDPESGSVTHLGEGRPEQESWLGLDGLALLPKAPDGSWQVAAVRNGVAPMGVLLFTLPPDWSEITRAEMIERNHPDYPEPTQITLAGDRLLYIPNAPWAKIGEGGSAEGDLAPTKVLQIPRQALTRDP